MSTETGTTVEKKKDYKLEYFTEFSLSSMDLAINNVTNLCNFVGKLVCVCVHVFVCAFVCISLLSTFITLSTLQNPFEKHIAYFKMVDFKNLAWATSFATRASRKFIYLPYNLVQGMWEKKLLSYPGKAIYKRPLHPLHHMHSCDG